MAFVGWFGATTTDAAVLSLALGTLRTQVLLEFETDVVHLQLVLDFFWPADNIFVNSHVLVLSMTFLPPFPSPLPLRPLPRDFETGAQRHDLHGK